MRLFGHPVHAMVVALPLALLGLVPLWDLAGWFGWLEVGATLAYYSELTGLAGGGLALLTGSAELVVVAKSRPEMLKPVLTHASLGLAAISVFGLALAFRAEVHAPSPAAIGLECLGAAVIAIAGWHGGRLVFEHGVAVDHAPQSAGARNLGTIGSRSP
jgi:uncharacterized membrane protein